jgi:SAM-dependent methyltransferase
MLFPYDVVQPASMEAPKLSRWRAHGEASAERDAELLRRSWNENARTDPFNAILTTGSKPGRTWDQGEFYRSGQLEITALFDRLRAQGLTPRPGRALDFGCGVGRLSEALADRFSEVKGVDISDSMISRARALSHHENVEYIANATPDLSLFPDGHFDFCVSHLVLQHTGRRLAMIYLGELVRVLARGGIAEVEVPVGFGGVRGFVAALLPNRILKFYMLRRHGVYYGFTYPIPEYRVLTIVGAAGGFVTADVPAEVNPASAIRSFLFQRLDLGAVSPPAGR